MFERLKILYKKDKVNEDGLAKAVNKKWITQEQKEQIVSAS
ncbi:XkdX family protein [Vallitalea maricola]|uniref:Uncharacterized protein n=1 Tax=Vallitalea maricola TaxID=3074433 RepID=A0ACB5UM59_9FIRM|nr:hypothetical protein AN2V17_32990 [Vallitalea sp. AN17-2]